LTGTAFKRILKLMGNRFEFTVVCPTESNANDCIDPAIAEVARIETLLSTFREDSQTNQINRNAGIKPVGVNQEVFDLIERSIKISRLTQGAFDLTYGSIDKRLWNFDVSMTSLPNSDLSRKSVRLINYRNILLDHEQLTVMLKEAGMRIGFGGIGKGYAADRAKKIMRDYGAKSGIVNAAGDLTTWGTQPNGRPWTIGIADPNQSALTFSTLNISDMSIATSGDYEKFAVINGKRYSHTINPTTGLPVSGVKSASIICESAELADAMATPVVVMGAKVALKLLNQVKNIACIVIDDTNTVYCTRNINIKT